MHITENSAHTTNTAPRPGDSNRPHRRSGPGRTDPLRRQRLRVARRVACAGTIAATLPYLTLKTLWLTGDDIGLTDPSFNNESGMVALNSATVAMDLVAVLVAVIFASRRGLRIPAWTVVLPMWVASGLLAPIAVTLPVTLATLADGADDPLPLQPWVRPIVYGGFTLQALTLGIGFALYAATRWGPPRVRSGDDETAGGPTDQVDDSPLSISLTENLRRMLTQLTFGAGAVAGIVAVHGLVHAWFFAEADTVTMMIAQGLVQTVQALFVVAGVVGVSLLVRTAGTVPDRRMARLAPVIAAWFGTGAMFAWGLWGLINVVGSSALTADAPASPILDHLLAAQTLAGLALGLAGLFALVSSRRRPLQ